MDAKNVIINDIEPMTQEQKDYDDGDDYAYDSIRDLQW